MRPLFLILTKRSGYVKTFKVKDGDKDKNNKWISFHIDDENKYKTIWTKTEILQNLKFNAFPIYEDKYIKIKIGTYREQFYINSTAEMCQRMV